MEQTEIAQGRRKALIQACEMLIEKKTKKETLEEWLKEFSYRSHEFLEVMEPHAQNVIGYYLDGVTPWEAVNRWAVDHLFPLEVIRHLLIYKLLGMLSDRVISREEFTALAGVANCSEAEITEAIHKWYADHKRPLPTAGVKTHIQPPSEAVAPAPVEERKIVKAEKPAIEKAATTVADTRFCDDWEQVGHAMAETMTGLQTACTFTGVVDSQFSRTREFLFKQAQGVAVRSVLKHGLDLFSQHSLARIPTIRPVQGGFVVECLKDDYELPPLLDFLENWESYKPTTIPKIKIGLDLRGNPVYLDYAISPVCIASGISGSGKTSLAEVGLIQSGRTSRPEHLQVCVIDTQQVNFQDYGNLPHLWQGCATSERPGWAGQVIHEADDIRNLFEQHRKEQLHRQEKFVEVGARSLDEYNSLCPNDPLPAILTIADEYRRVKNAVPDVESFLLDGVEAFRKFGFYYLLLIHYPKGVISPAMRGCQKIALHMPEEFSDAFLGKPIASSLAMGGDGFLVNGEFETRFQTFSLGREKPEIRKFVQRSVEEIRQQYPRRYLAEKPRDLWLPEGQGTDWLTKDRYIRLTTLEEVGLSQSAIFEKVFADVHANPRNGGSFEACKKKAEKLKEVFGSVAA